MDNTNLVGKIIRFSIVGRKHFGKINAYLQEYDTYLVNEPRDLATDDKFQTIIEVEQHEIEHVYEEPIYYFISNDFDVLSLATTTTSLSPYFLASDK